MARIPLLIAAFLAASSGSELALQAADTLPGRPVDQTVEDIDPHAASLRRVEAGPGQFSDVRVYVRRPTLWTADSGATLQHGYSFRAPGMEVLMDRPMYLVQLANDRLAIDMAPGQERQFRELLPANTVYNLIPEHLAGRTAEATPPPPNPHQLDLRVDGRYQPPALRGGRVELSPVEPTRVSSPPMPPRQRRPLAPPPPVTEATADADTDTDADADVPAP